MAFSASGLYVVTFIDVFDATQLAIDLSLTSHKIALYNNSLTPNYSSDSAYSATNEVTGTNWASGGVALSVAAAGGTSTAPTVTESPSGSLMYDMGDVAVASTTLSAVRGMILYADALAGNNLIVGITFGADYSTSNGTFGINWNALGVFAIDLLP